MTDLLIRTPRVDTRTVAKRALIASAVVIALIPVDFVRVDPVWRYLTLAALAVGVIAAVRVLAAADIGVVKQALAFGFVVIALNQFMNFNPIGFLTLLAPVVVGAGLVVVVRSPLTITMGLLLVLAASMGIEFLLQEHLFGQFFGAENYVAYSRDVFRSRGLIGQAVPAGMIAVGLAAAALTLSSTLTKNRTGMRWVIAGATLVSIFASGTRSSIVCAAVLAILAAAGTFHRNKNSRRAIGQQLAWAGPLLLAAGVLVVTFYWTVLANQRVFSFDTLDGSASLENRNYAAMVFADWGESCTGTCVFLGSGARSLLDALGNGLGFRGFTTVDNLFLSLLWDFGVLMLVGIVVLIVVAIRTILVSGSVTNRAGAMLIVSIMLSGIFYDALYIRPTLLLLGFGIGLLGLRTTICARNPS